MVGARGVVIGAMLCVAVAIGGCGASTKTVSKTTAATNATTAAAAQSPAQAGSSSPLIQGVVRKGELAGMAASPAPSVVNNLSTWVAGDQLGPQAAAAEVARLRRLGFVAGISENLVTPHNQNRYGLSLLEEFKTHSGAEAEFAHATGPLATGGPWTHFTVSGIPGANGFDAIGPSNSGRNIAFVVGSTYYLEGAGWQAAASNAVSRAQVAAAATLIYKRMKGK